MAVKTKKGVKTVAPVAKKRGRPVEDKTEATAKAKGVPLVVHVPKRLRGLAKMAANANGSSLSEVIRDFLEKYIQESKKQIKRYLDQDMSEEDDEETEEVEDADEDEDTDEDTEESEDEEEDEEEDEDDEE